MKENFTDKPIIAIIGRPNTGKSTLFNVLIKERLAIESATAGTTRNRLYAPVGLKYGQAILTDTAGLFDLKKSSQQEINDLIKDNVMEAIDEADLIIFTVEFLEDTNRLDVEIATNLRRAKKKVIVAVNKCDNPVREQQIAQFGRWGNWPVIALSATHKRNLDSLIETIEKELEMIFKKTKQTKEPLVDLRLAIIGRPNTGKSTLFNTLGESKVIVSSVPGTTRDIIKGMVNYKNLHIEIIDTAGVKRPGKTKDIEYFSTLRTIKAIEMADVCLLLLDATEGVVAVDKNIVGEIIRAGKGIILVFNKIDLIEEYTLNKLVEKITSEFPFLPYAPLVCISAKDDKNCKILLSQAIKIILQSEQAIAQHELDELKDLIQNQYGQLPKISEIKYRTNNPPTFLVKLATKKSWNFSFSRYLENRIRDNFKFTGLPIRIELIEKD